MIWYQVRANRGVIEPVEVEGEFLHSLSIGGHWCPKTNRTLAFRRTRLECAEFVLQYREAERDTAKRFYDAAEAAVQEAREMLKKERNL